MKNIRYIAIKILPLLIIFTVLTSCVKNSQEMQRFGRVLREFPEVNDQWKIMAENNFYRFSLNGKTAAFKLEDLASGKIWYSNPQDIDPGASRINKNYINSQFRFTYYNEGSIKKSMNSYADSVEQGQFKIDRTEHGASVTYSLGDVEDIQLIPMAIRQDRYEAFLEKVTDNRYKSQMDKRYVLYDPDKARTDTERERMLKEYPQSKNHPVYVFDELDNKAVLERVEAGFVQAGYTLDDLIFDNSTNNVPEKDRNLEIFSITIEYELKDNAFIVKVPTDSIAYHPTFPLTELRLLEFFGASMADAHDGFMLIPDGSGAIIELDNGKSWASGYYANVYGTDPSIAIKERGMKQLPATMPVFAMKQDDDALFARITNGDAHANIFADVAGKLNSYNFIGSEYTLLPHSPVTMESLQGAKFVNTYQSEPFQGAIEIEYYSFHGDSAEYPAMAQFYSSLIFNGGPEIKDVGSPDLFLDIYMAIDKIKNFMGIPYNGIEVLTSFDETQQILDELASEGIKEPLVNLVGWQKGGVTHDVSFKRAPQLGNRRTFQGILDYSKSENIPVFFEGSVTRALKNRMFDGFRPNFHTVQLLDRNDAKMYPFSLSTNAIDKKEDPEYLLGYGRAKKLIQTMLKKVVRRGLTGINFRYASSLPHSEFFERSQIPRQQGLAIVEEKFDYCLDNGVPILSNLGLAYSLPYASAVTNLPLESNNFYLSDGSIPFLPMVLSGHIPYSGKAINLDDPQRRTFLKSLENGAVPHFALIYRDNSKVVHTDHDYLYSVEYSNWKEPILQWCQEAKEIMTLTGGTALIGHHIIAPEQVLVEYANGSRWLINYSDEPYTYENQVIEGEGYTIVR